MADINLAAAEKAVGYIASQSPTVKAIALKVDIGRESEVKALVESAVATFGRLDVMVSPQITDQKRSPIEMWPNTVQQCRYEWIPESLRAFL